MSVKDGIVPTDRSKVAWAKELLFRGISSAKKGTKLVETVSLGNYLPLGPTEILYALFSRIGRHARKSMLSYQAFALKKNRLFFRRSGYVSNRGRM